MRRQLTWKSLQNYFGYKLKFGYSSNKQQNIFKEGRGNFFIVSNQMKFDMYTQKYHDAGQEK
jgi:hypothetical protein